MRVYTIEDQGNIEVFSSKTKIIEYIMHNYTNWDIFVKQDNDTLGKCLPITKELIKDRLDVWRFASLYSGTSNSSILVESKHVR